MRAFFLSDLHLTQGDSPVAQGLVAFLRDQPARGDVLILGGDVFDLFIGNKKFFREKFAAVLEAISSAAKGGVRVYYLEGNHDFHFSGVFGSASSVEIRADEFWVEAGPRRIFVSHGDLIDPDDKGYLFLRALLRNPLVRALVWILPGSWINGIGTLSSRESRKYTDGARQGHQERIRRLYLDFARAKMKAGAQHVLLGHSHLPDQVQVNEVGARGEYVNLGFTGRELQYAVLHPGAEFFSIERYPAS
jgi:UDP-2,3-diacylglucosamine hydrolase